MRVKIAVFETGEEELLALRFVSKRSLVVASVACVVVVGSGALASTAAAAPATTDHTSVTKYADGSVEFVQTLPNGQKHVYGWRNTSSKAGLHNATVTPNSADGCNGDVCIDIIGSGTTVDEWSTTAYGNVGCTFASYYDNYANILDGYEICPNSSDVGVYYDYWFPSGYPFHSGDRVCNSWAYMDGYPCETIE